MQSTLELLAKATAIKSIPEWTQALGLSQKALYTAKDRGHLTPVMAGGLAVALNENPEQWITLAVMEGEKDSPAKRALEKQLKKLRNL